jgi:CHAT domain-containing protein
VIVPQGALNLVPFAALPQGRRGSYGERFALRYAPSLATLAETERRPALPAARRGELRHALVVGNPVMPEVEPADAEAAPAAMLVTRGGGTRLEPLPAAEAEARQVATRFGAPLLTGAEASETRIRRELATAPLVHLATHGIVYSSDARVRQSFLALAPDSLHDGRLTVGEVIDEGPMLSAELVVLSACQTGLGNLRQAEGTVGLQRAFLARGARGVLVSLWSVSDEATGLLMQSFYRHWLDDRDEPSKAEALRRAQMDVRRVPKFREPLYWAAFQLVGAR